jgi:hypothetical protein
MAKSLVKTFCGAGALAPRLNSYEAAGKKEANINTKICKSRKITSCNHKVTSGRFFMKNSGLQFFVIAFIT